MEQVELQLPAVSMLRHLSLNSDLKAPCVSAGALRPIVRCVRWATEDLMCQCAGAMANMSEERTNQVLASVR